MGYVLPPFNIINGTATDEEVLAWVKKVHRENTIKAIVLLVCAAGMILMVMVYAWVKVVQQ